jgi:hypothetical protein
MLCLGTQGYFGDDGDDDDDDDDNLYSNSS